MNVTLICDASYCDRYKVAGYGYWIACSRGKKGGEGIIVQDVETSGIAEMMAVCNTVWSGIANNLIEVGDKLLIQTDCQQAIDTMRGLRKPSNPQEEAVMTYFDKTIVQNKLRVEFRHVKGHTQIAAARFAANRMCDKRAKKSMRQARMSKMREEMKEFLE